MVERKLNRFKEKLTTARTAAVELFRRRRTKEDHNELVHPLVAEYGTAAHAKNVPDEDANAEVPRKGVFIVADGIGSTPEGSSASHLACDIVAIKWDKTSSKDGSLTSAIADMLGSIRDAQATIVAEATTNPDKAHMGTTIVVAKLWESKGEKKVIFGWAGDSKGAIQRTDGTLEQVTRDDDLASFFVHDREKVVQLQNKISNAVSYEEFGTETIVTLNKPMPLNVYRDGRVEQDDVTDLSEQHFFAGRNFVLQSLGVDALREVNIEVRDVSSGDLIVLSTDGESDNNTHKEREAILAGAGTALEKAQKLRDAAIAKSQERLTPHNARPKRDDIRVTVVKVA